MHLWKKEYKEKGITTEEDVMEGFESPAVFCIGLCAIYQLESKVSLV